GYDAPLQSALAEARAAVSRAEQARAGLLPSAGLSAGASYTRTDVNRPPIDLSTPQQTAGITASQPLYRPANRIAFEQGQRGVDIAQARLEAAQQDLIVRLSQAYFDVLAARDTLDTLRAQKAAVSEQRASAQRNFEVGNA
ncbi:TolC family protein, partial [Novosphingobium sp. 18052]